MVIVIARFRPHPDRREDLLALLREVQTASRADDGCLAYGYYAEIADGDALIAVEEWRDRASLAAHLRTPHVERLIAALADHLAGPPEIAAHDVERSGALPFGESPGRRPTG